MALSWLRKGASTLANMGVSKDASQNAIRPIASIDEKRLWNSVRKVTAYLDNQNYDQRKTLFAIMRTEWGNLAGDILLITPPFDRGGKISDGIKDVAATVKSAFKPLNSVPFGDLVRAQNWRAVSAYGYKFKSKRLQAALDKKNWNVIKNLKMGIAGDVAYAAKVEPIPKIQQKYHRVVRDARTGRWNGTQFHVAGKGAKREISDFAKTAAKNVGLMASGWAYCHDALGGKRKIPKLNNKGTGKVIINPFGRDGSTARVAIINSLGNWNGWLGQKKTQDVNAAVDKAVNKVQQTFHYASIGAKINRTR